MYPVLYIAAAMLVLALFLPNSNSEKNLDLHGYLPPVDDIADTANRYQQFSKMHWQESQQLKAQKINVKAEIEKLNNTYSYQHDWPDPRKKLGSVSAVSFDKDGNVVVFHRVDRIWSMNTFDNGNNYLERAKGAIGDNTVVAFDRKTGQVVYEWGKGLFYMPHGLTIDHENNVWVTDVALHQVMKFGPNGSADKPEMVLGTAFTPGRNQTTFCKPTSVAVLPNGDFFIADGYCNARIIKLSKAGQIILTWGENSFQGEAHEVAPPNFFAVPHGLTIVKDLGLICVADRENGRVQCFHTNNGTFHSQYHSKIIGDRLFSVDYAPISGGQLFVVNGPVAELGKSDHYNEVHGYTIDMKSKNVLSKFGTNDLQFSNPHDIVVTEDGNEIYVAELDPYRVHKFISKNLVKNEPNMSSAKPTATLTGITESPRSITIKRSPTGLTALVIVALLVIISLLIFGLALLISRRNKRGCLPFGVRNRRHAWDFPTVKSDGFKLGNLLDRKRGFEKLEQNASDEEPDASTNMLSSAQFA